MNDDDTPLAYELGQLWRDYDGDEKIDIVIVGSGYGGSVAAAGLAGCEEDIGGQRRKLRVCVLERGRHWPAGEFPARFADLPGHVRLVDQTGGRVAGNPEGLFDVRMGDDVMALVGNGLGGGSLINAGVLLPPDRGDFDGARWATWRAVLRRLERGGWFEHALRDLGGVTARGRRRVVNDIDRHRGLRARRLDKTIALERLQAAEGSTGKWKLPSITVAMKAGPNQAGVELARCTLCGDCLTGCNVGAKNSLDVGLLHRAQRAGAEIYVGASVISLERDHDHWVLNVTHADPELQQREPCALRLRARRVILAAGSLGSSEILLRSRDDALRFSPRLGEGFSCNGDDIAAAYGMPVPAHGSADEDQPGEQRRVGPTISATFELRAGVPRSPQVQEFAVPAPLKRLLDEVVTTAHALHDLPNADPSTHGGEPTGTPDPLAVSEQAIEHTLLVGLIGHDDAAGSLRLPQPVRPREGPPIAGTVCIHWPGARRGREVEAAHERLAKLVQQLSTDARLIANPLWRLLPQEMEELASQPRGPVLTVHPLGGCCIGDRPTAGVVDHCGRVFDLRPSANNGAADAAAWQGSLVVLDGSIVPGSLGVNPALTIAALAMRSVRHLRRAWGLRGGMRFGTPQPRPRQPRERVDAPAQLGEPPAPVPTEVEVIERLSGPVWLDVGAYMPRRCIVELTLAYESRPVTELTSTFERELVVDCNHRHSRLRLYDARDWDDKALRVFSDRERKPELLLEALFDAGSSLRFLHREASRPWLRALRAGWAYLRNRGWRDIRQGLQERREKRRANPAATEGSGLWNVVRAAWRLAHRAGEVRRFDYRLRVGKVLEHRLGASAPLLRAGGEVVGCKRLTYDRRANPWQQLTRLRLDAMPGLHDVSAPVLKLDTGFMAGIGVPLLRLKGQRDHATALADLASFGLLFVRVLLSVHLWTFRKPDAPSRASPRRLPAVVAGITPQVTELVVDRMPGRDAPVKIRLSRYPPRQDAGLPPLLMIHGYSASGSTFTHESLEPSAAAYFHRCGRDVWVLDLRTSAGLPTATHPWAFEDAALVDIPAALLHVRAVTGQRVDVLAHCIGAAMLGMAILADAREVRSKELQLGADTQLAPEHLGQLAAFHGLPAPGVAHPCIRRVVLTQKGPVLRYSDANVLRAYLMQYIRRLVFSADYQFRPPAEPRVSDELFDRVLASLPYPKADYDAENPAWQATGWTATRHRMDALFGRTFSAANLRPATLEAIDDFFGPLNLDSIAQTAHFARFSAITNQAGRGEFVTGRRLHERWSGIPTLALHGADNGIADVDTLRLLGLHLQGAGVPFESVAFKDMGHQDLLIGTTATRAFDEIERFLAGAAPPAKQANLGGWVFAPPWAGPRIDIGQGALRVAAMPRPDQGRARLLLVPARRHGPRWLVQPHAQPLQPGAQGVSGEWLFAAVPPALPPGEGEPGWLGALVYKREETITTDVPGKQPSPPPRKPQPVAPPPAARVPRLPDPGWYDAPLDLARLPAALVAAPVPLPLDPVSPVDVERALLLWSDEELESSFIAWVDLDRVRRQQLPLKPVVPFVFTVGSCQYPYGLIDGDIAGASLRAMEQDLPDCGLALLVGDQIYADATAGLLDATRRDERYDQPYDRALRVDALRALMRRVPVQVLPDDHELIDNWEPFAPAAGAAWPVADGERKRTRELGLDAFFRYQRLTRRVGDPLVDIDFRYAGYPFFLLDTRTRRSGRGSSLADDEIDIISPPQWQRFKAWLRAHAHELKFVASGSLLLPRRREVAAQAAAAGRSDTWDGHPHSLHRLLAFLALNDIRRTVFVSGDEHHSLFAEATLEPGGVQLVSVHASALYAPYPFANGRPQDFKEVDHFSVGSGVTAHVRTTYAQPGDGYARIDVLPGDAPRLCITFWKTGGGSTSYQIALA
jgi:cholesterol oxidase